MHTHYVYTAVIEHRHGMNDYVAATDEELERQLFKYVKDNIHEISATDARETIQYAIDFGKNYQEAIEAYFDQNDWHQEYLTQFGRQEVEFKDSEDVLQRLLTVCGKDNFTDEDEAFMLQTFVHSMPGSEGDEALRKLIQISPRKYAWWFERINGVGPEWSQT